MLINLLLIFCISLSLCAFVLLIVEARFRAQERRNLFFQRRINDLSHKVSSLSSLVNTRGAATDALARKISRIERAISGLSSSSGHSGSVPLSPLRGTLRLKDSKGKIALIHAEFFLDSGYKMSD